MKAFTKDPHLARDLRESVRIVGIRDTARAMGVSPDKLRKMMDSEEFEGEHLARAKMLGFFDERGGG